MDDERPTFGAVADVARPLILTALMERSAFERFDGLRRAHFPPERNIVPAHVTLFHHLPGPERDAVNDRLAMVARGTRAFDADVTGLRSLGKGVAYMVRSHELEHLRDELADAWAPLLIPQDRQGWRGHVTVQNKVKPAEAKALLDRLSAGFAPWRFRIEGLTLWRYDDGPWTRIKDHRFAR